MSAPNWFKKNLILVIILVVASILRLIAVNPGYNPYHGDETAIWGSSLNMVKKGTYDPGRYDYPATAMVINAFFYKTVFIPGSWVEYYLNNLGDVVDGKLKLNPVPLEKNKLFDLYIAGERGVNAIFWSRYTTAFFGIGTVYLTYLLSKKMFSKEVGLLSALFLTFNYRNVVNSHLALPDIYNAFFLLLALITSWNLYKKPNKVNYLLAGLVTGMSFAVKYQIFSLVPLTFIHFALVFGEKTNLKSYLKKIFDVRFIAACLLVPLVFMLFNPYFFMNMETVLLKMDEEFKKYGMGTNIFNFYPISYLFNVDYGPIQSIFVVIGILVGITKKYLFKTMFFFSYLAPVLYMFLYYSKGGFYVRNFIPITPLFLIFASIAVWKISSFIGSKFGRVSKHLLLILVVAIVLYQPAKNSILSSYGFTLPWGYDTLRPWIKDNIPEDALVAAHPFDKSNLSIKNVTTEFAPSEAYSLSEHIDNKADYVIVDLNWASLPFYFWMSYSPDEVRLLWNKPVELLDNTFHGLAANELFRYQIHTVTKPWQSPDTHFVVVKTPKWPIVEMKTIKRFTFDDSDEVWKVYGRPKPNSLDRYKFDAAMGSSGKGSLVIMPGGDRFPVARMTSDPVPVTEGHLYKISGQIKSGRVIPSKERDGFIRVDFYNGLPDRDLLGLSPSVSSRHYGSEGWSKKEIFAISPQDAKYMTVSFQTYSATTTEIWLDDVVVTESKDLVEDITKKMPYTNKIIDLNYLYPNSHGNL